MSFDNRIPHSELMTTTEPVARYTKISDLQDRATCAIWSTTEPNAAGVYGISRSLAYREARTGGLPTIRIGGRVLVKVPELLRMLGAEAN